MLPGDCQHRSGSFPPKPAQTSGFTGHRGQPESPHGLRVSTDRRHARLVRLLRLREEGRMGRVTNAGVMYQGWWVTFSRPCGLGSVYRQQEPREQARSQSRKETEHGEQCRRCDGPGKPKEQMTRMWEWQVAGTAGGRFMEAAG